MLLEDVHCKELLYFEVMCLVERTLFQIRKQIPDPTPPVKITMIKKITISNAQNPFTVTCPVLSTLHIFTFLRSCSHTASSYLISLDFRLLICKSSLPSRSKIQHNVSSVIQYISRNIKMFLVILLTKANGNRLFYNQGKMNHYITKVN